jgi:hypothetical protein
VHTFDGRVVFVNEVALDQLYGQAGLAHTAAADHHQLVLAKKLRETGTLAAIRLGPGRRFAGVERTFDDMPAV